MPYIKPESRQKYKESIFSAQSVLTFEDNKTFDVGELNYFISSVIWYLFDNNPRYKTANDLIGVLEGVKQEFYRRKVSELENKKILENGDIQ